jgi:hypothetical protein
MNTGIFWVSLDVFEYLASDMHILCWLYAVTHVGYYDDFLLIGNTLDVKDCKTFHNGNGQLIPSFTSYLIILVF